MTRGVPYRTPRRRPATNPTEEAPVSATITLRHRDGALTVADNDTVRAIARAVETYERGGGDQQFRVRRSRTLAVRFRASQVDGVNANGVDLTDVASPVDVAAERSEVAA